MKNFYDDVHMILMERLETVSFVERSGNLCVYLMCVSFVLTVSFVVVYVVTIVHSVPFSFLVVVDICRQPDISSH